MKKPPNSDKVPDFAPGEISENAAREHFERGARPTIDRNRSFLLNCILGAALVGQSVAMAMLFPLKTVETQIVRSYDGGRMNADGVAVGNWTPDKDEIGYFLGRWVNQVFDINQATIMNTIRESSEMTIGNATAQLKDLRTRDNPLVLLKGNPNLIRTYEYIALNFIEDNVGYLRFKTTTRDNGEPKTVVYAMRITFTRVKPTTREQIMRNPAGLFVTSFNLTEEVPPK
jgi:type IV secretory pathway component VirB8